MSGNKYWYRWHDEQRVTAQAALDYLNSNPSLPIVPLVDGTPDPNAQPIVEWASALVQCVDSHVGFARLNDELLDFLQISEEQRQLFIDTFNPTIEEFDRAWLPVDEEP